MEADWSPVDGSLSATQVARGVTAAFTPPAGGGAFVFGFDSKVTTSGFAGLFANKINFAPLKNGLGNATGGSIRFAMKKLPSPNSTGWAPFVFFCLRAGVSGGSNPSVNDVGYLFGLENSDPARIVFRKGTPASGLPSDSTLIRTSNTTYGVDTWLHLRMDVIVNPNGDVVLKFFQNDVNAAGADVATPTWVAVTGANDFIDDSLGILSGSAPLSGGFIGFGQWSNQSQRRSAWDQIEIARQIG